MPLKDHQRRREGWYTTVARFWSHSSPQTATSAVSSARASLKETKSTITCGEVTIEVSSEETAGDCDGSYTLTRTFTATDDVATAHQPLRPSRLRTRQLLSSRAFLPTTRLSALTRCLWTTRDNCSDVSITVESETIAGDAAGNYTIVRTFTATDACGNSTSASQTITVEDTTAPELSIPADYTAECSDELILDDATATDNCGEVTIEVSSEDHRRRLRWQLHCDAHVHGYGRRWQQHVCHSDHHG